MKKIYLSASWPRRAELQRYMRELEDLGHRVTARWLKTRHRGDSVSRDVAKRYCTEDLADIKACDALVLFLGDNTSRGGKWVELGFALALKKKIVTIGSPHEGESIFALMASEHFDSWKEFRKQWIKPKTSSK